MSLQIGTKLAHYEILEPIGKGGMGEVYRAKDSRLGRLVAIKILTPENGNNPTRLERFRREARVISNLNHPNICTLYDIGTESGIDFLVLEYLQGETLADLLKNRHSLPYQEAVNHGRQVLDALVVAHRAKIVHRDLKPENIFLTHSGVKVLDFGLARLSERESSTGASLSEAATAARSITQDHVIVGTLPYMAPEQLRGERVDTRTDLFAFGVIIFEMLTGGRPFRGDTRADLIGQILASKPDYTELPSDVPSSMTPTLAACLQADREERWQSARDLRRVFDELSNSLGAASTESARQAHHWNWRAVFAALGLAAGALGASMLIGGGEARVESFSISPPPGTRLAMRNFAVSPKGDMLAFGTPAGENLADIWLRPIVRDKTTLVERLRGRYPFFSPDGNHLGIMTWNEKLRVFSINERTQLDIVDIADGRGASWSKSGDIVYSPSGRDGLLVVPASGGEPRPVTELREGEYSHRFPQFLPGKDEFLYLAGHVDPTKSGIFVASVSGGLDKRIVDSLVAPYYGDGHLVYSLANSVVMQSFDASTYALRGAAFVLMDLPPGASGRASSVVVSSGVLIRGVFGDLPLSSLAFVDRSGKELRVVGASRRYASFALSPDGQRVVTTVDDGSMTDLWLLDRSGRTSRLTATAVLLELGPVWSPNGRELVFSRDDGPAKLFKLKLEPKGIEPELLVSVSNAQIFVSQWHPNGSIWFSQVERRGEAKASLWFLDSSGRPSRVHNSEFNEFGGQLSPDGQWLAYSSDETGRFEVYVTLLDDGPQRRISLNGGRFPRWSKTGEELFYQSFEDDLMAFSFDPDKLGETQPTTLFRVGGQGGNDPDFAVGPDGQFLINRVESDADESQSLQVILDWQTNLPRGRGN